MEYIECPFLNRSLVYQRYSYRYKYLKSGGILPDGSDFSSTLKNFYMYHNLDHYMIKSGFTPALRWQAHVLLSVLWSKGQIYLTTYKNPGKLNVRMNSSAVGKFVLGTDNKTFQNLVKRMIEIDLLVCKYDKIKGIRSSSYDFGPKLKKRIPKVADFKEWQRLFAIRNRVPTAQQRSFRLAWEKASVYLGYKKFSNAKEDEQGNELLKNTLSQVTIQPKEVREKVLSSVVNERFERNKTKVEENQLSKSEIRTIYEYGLNEIDQGRFYAITHDSHYDRPTGRIFSTITSLKKEFRQFLMLDGEKLFNVDVQSCQMALLSSFYDTENMDHCLEKVKFLDAICKKDFYSHLAGEEMSRQESKEGMIHVTFGKIWGKKSQAYNRFKELFPILDQIILEKKRKDGYKSISHAMQSLEAQIMISGALKQLQEEGIKAIPIHDSFLCKEGDIERVKFVILQNFVKRMCFIPNVQIETA